MSDLDFATYFQGGEHDARSMRLVHSSLIGVSGVVHPDDLAVTELPTPTMQVRVAPGSVFLEGDQITRQGAYHGTLDQPADLNIAPSDATNDRIDLVVIRIRDAAFAGSDNRGEVAVITGTPAGDPQPPAVPDNTLVRATVTVPAAAEQITDADIDLHPIPAAFRGSLLRHADLGANHVPAAPGELVTDAHMRDYVDTEVAQGVVGRAEVTSDQSDISSEADITGLSVTVDIESGRWYRVWAKTEVTASAPTVVARVRLYAGASAIQGGAATIAASSSGASSTVGAEVVRTFSGGSATFKATLERMSGSGTLDSRASPVRPSQIVVEDLGPAT